MNIMIPLIIVAVVYVLYKFPPRRLNKRPKVKPSKRTAAKLAAKHSTARKSNPAAKRKQYPFQVIDGQKENQTHPMMFLNITKKKTVQPCKLMPVGRF